MALRAPDLKRLQRIVSRLRALDGCPWDRQQTLASLERFLLEEAYEVLDVMAGDDAAVHCDELGDLLFQIVFQAQIREEQGAFELADVVDAISDKLERRHPHVFGDAQLRDAAAVEVAWDALKRAEGKGALGDVPRALPALMRAEKLGQRAAKAGFDWPDVEGPLAKVDEELAELRAAMASGDLKAAEDELGDVLFAAVNVARHLGIHPEAALAGTNDRFVHRYAEIEAALAARGRSAADASIDELERLWQQAKVALAERAR